MPRTTPTLKSSYPRVMNMPTRWADNDPYGHVNNVAYYSFFDTAVNKNLIESNVLDIENSAVIGVVVETHCSFLSPVCFPDELDVGLKVVKLGEHSVQYEIGIFRSTQDHASAVGYFTHVYVDRETRRPANIPAQVRHVLSTLVCEPAPATAQI